MLYKLHKQKASPAFGDALAARRFGVRFSRRRRHRRAASGVEVKQRIKGAKQLMSLGAEGGGARPCREITCLRPINMWGLERLRVKPSEAAYRQ